jgi:hypothetical protein
MKTIQKYLTSAWKTTESDTETTVTAKRETEGKKGRILCSDSGTKN